MCVMSNDPADLVEMTTQAAGGISFALGQDFNRVETPERMAWVFFLLRYIKDSDERFPMGKWATIQSIEAQLEKAASDAVEEMGVACTEVE